MGSARIIFAKNRIFFPWGFTINPERHMSTCFVPVATVFFLLAPPGMPVRAPSMSSSTLSCPDNPRLYHRTHPTADIDGAYFGTTFAHLLLLNFPGSRPPSTRQVYVPKIFGFRQYTPAGEEEGRPGSSKQVLLNKSDGARMIADATLRKQQMTSVLDREGAQILVSPYGKRLEVFNEDFLDLEELLAQQKSGSHKRGKK